MDARAALFALLVVLSGCAAAPTQGTESPTRTPAPTDPGQSSPTGGDRTATAGAPATDTPGADASNDTDDRLGREDGYRFDGELAIDRSDGLNETELDAVVARTMARVEHLRGLEFDRTVPVEVISRETYVERYGGQRDVARERRAVDNAVYEALFLVGEDDDANEAARSNLGAAVQGFYVPSTDRIAIVAPGDTPDVSETVLAHELLHALQYSRFDLRSEEPESRDRHRALDALVEGDARHLDRLYGARCRAEWDCVTGSAGGSDGDLHFGVYYLQSFPYSDGGAFVRHVHEEGGWDAVNALYEAPPESTEQVVDPTAYRNDSPRSVRLPDRSADGWSAVDAPGRPVNETVGQAGIAAMFANPVLDDRPGVVVPADRLFNPDPERDDDRLDGLDPYHYDFAYPDGWGGDTLRVYEDGTGAIGYAWRIVWDSSGDAREFADGYRDLLEYWGGERTEAGVWRVPENESGFADAFRVRVDGDAVTIVNAPTVEQLSSVHAPEDRTRERAAVRGADASRA